MRPSTLSQSGRLEPEQWDDDVTEPRRDAFELAQARMLWARKEHEFGLDHVDVDPVGYVS